MAKYGFKTAYLQRELVFDAAVVKAATGNSASDTALNVGNCVTLVAASGSVPQYFKLQATPAVGDYIIAQSDMTLEYGHVPVENRDYRYSDEVKTAVHGSTVVATATSLVAGDVKKVAVFRISDLSDIVTIVA